MSEKCNKCLYSCPVNVGEDSKMLRACVYILLTGSRRPCAAGAKCTVYSPRRGRRVPVWL